MSRQKILLAIVAVLLVAQVGDWLLQHAIKGPMQQRRARQQQLQRSLKQKKQQFELLKRQLAQLHVWESQSLPRNPDVARSLYRSWLLDLTARLKFLNRRVDAGSPVNHRGLYQTIGFTVRGRATLKRVLAFFHEFYSANQLHLIRSFSLVPVGGSELLDVVIGIEGMILPTADRADRLASGTVKRTAWHWPDDYNVILDRNLFGFKVSSGPDLSHLILLTAVLESNGRPEAWLTLQAQDKVLKLHVGDELPLGPVSAKVVEITDTDLVLELNGQRWLLTVGDRLSDATALPPEL